jgi:hypothetical protein
MWVDLEQGVDKRRNGRTLGKDHQASEQQQHQDHRGEPPPLALPKNCNRSPQYQTIDDAFHDLHVRYSRHHAFGLFNHVVPETNVHATADECAEGFLRGIDDRFSFRLKEVFRRQGTVAVEGGSIRR